MSRRTIMVLDDHPVVLQGVVQVLRSDQLLEVTGAFERSADLVKAMKAAPPDVVVLDYQLDTDDADGLNLLMRLRRYFPDTKVIMLSGSERPANVHVLLERGASAFVGKTRDPEILLTAVRSVLRGQSFVSPELPPVAEKPAANVHLTDREREVIRCCIAGMTTSAIAAKFNRSEPTISTQKRAAFRKLGIQSDPDLHRAAADHLLDHLL
ncbi:DNA-binding response regulator [Stenotrophomonas maltophilia]|uniref:DNA-binding response regulator n=1 Tax=Stenotrophomonas maltophilia TaxID=40324 RepID=A0A270MXS8_STEMA|nr:response regulator transcription factor [Stenotrophomonas maltophilia]PAM64679.1 DNA-binding response regulator [Stenotrophomonas maltophilia]PAM71836.1 DNA-binding response regulator [Stenotrophomonas maltophilia]